MTVPVLENGPWVFNVNNVFNTDGEIWNRARVVILGIKNALVALGGAGTIWQVVASSDASSVKNIGDADPDLWIDTGDIVITSGVHSWCIFENQTTGAQFSIAVGYGNPYYWSLRFSPGGTFNADGTTSVLPTSTDSNNFWVYDLVYNCPDNTDYKDVAIHVMASADHVCLRVFVLYKNNLIGGSYGAMPILIEGVANTPSVWSSTIKYALFKQPTNLGYSATVTLMSPTMADLDGVNWYAYFETTEPYSGWLSCFSTAECYGGLYNNTAKILCYNSVSQEFPGGYPVSPIGLFRGNPYGGSFGRLQDLYFAPNTHGMLDTYPADSSRSWTKVGCLLVPWNGTEPLGL